MNKTKSVAFKTPRGTAKYPRLDQPYSWNDAMSRNVPDPEGQFEVKILVPEKEAQPFVKVIKDAIAEAGVKPKFLPFKPEVDPDTGDNTGNIEFTLKRYGKAVDGKPNKIAFFDSKGRPVSSDVYLTSGSTIICAGWISVSKQAARLNIKACQIVKLIERTDDGFAPIDDEDGFVADDNLENNEFDNEETDSGRPNF